MGYVGNIGVEGAQEHWDEEHAQSDTEFPAYSVVFGHAIGLALWLLLMLVSVVEAAEK